MFMFQNENTLLYSCVKFEKQVIHYAVKNATSSSEMI